jgi:molybdopterin-synthase adenylyltransferase
MEELDRSRNDPHIAVIGLGSIGCALLPRILRMPCSVITLVDGDRVEEKNLDRQELYAPVDVGRPKVDVAAVWARNAPVTPTVEAIDQFLDHQNAEALIAMHDLVIDCTDDLHVRRLIDRTCRDYGVLLISGAVHARQGQVLTLHQEGPGHDLTLDRLFSGQPGAEQDGCDMRNVPLTVIEEIAKRMAWRVREWLNGVPLINGRIEVYDDHLPAWVELAPPQMR